MQDPTRSLNGTENPCRRLLVVDLYIFWDCYQSIKTHSVVSTNGGGGVGGVGGVAGVASMLTLSAPSSRDQQSAWENPLLVDWILSIQITPPPLHPSPPSSPLPTPSPSTTNPITLAPPQSHIVDSVALLTKCCGPILAFKWNNPSGLRLNSV